jgi:uncharacterized protein YyaL (SSP411 family)
MVEDGRLRHSWRHGRLKHPATLDDYALLSDAALALYEATGAPSYLAQVGAWIGTVKRPYLDSEGGGFFLTADDTTELIVRSKNALDNATPSGNGTLAAVLARLFYLTGKDGYRQDAEDLIAAFSGELTRNFFPFASLLNGNELLLQAIQVVVLGERAEPASQALIGTAQAASLPTRVLQVVAPDDPLPDGHPAAGKGARHGKPTAYVCRGMTCSLPITEPEELARALSS